MSNTKILNHIKKTKSYMEGLRAGEELKRSNFHKGAHGDDVGRVASQPFQLNHKNPIGKRMAAEMARDDIKEEDENENEDEDDSKSQSSDEDDGEFKDDLEEKSSHRKSKQSGSQKSNSHSNDLDVSRGQRSYRFNDSNHSIDEVDMPFKLPKGEEPTTKIIKKSSDKNETAKNSVRQSLFSHAIGSSGNLLVPNTNHGQKALLSPPIRSEK